MSRSINLDYKLREELRAELTQLFAGGRTTVVYATTEPQEALQLGGHTALLAEGRVLQSGPTLEVFRRPATLEAARAFSDPPLNVIPATLVAARRARDGLRLPIAAQARGPIASEIIVLGIRAHEFSLAGDDRAARAARPGRARGDQRLRNVHPSRARRRVAWSRRFRACTICRSTSPAPLCAAREPVRLRSQRAIAVRAGDLSVARIDLQDVGHRYAGAGRRRGRCGR